MQRLSRPRTGTLLLSLALAMLFALTALAAVSAEPLPEPKILRKWIQEMKDNPRGPFKRIRWFCNDGTVHPPRPYPCEDRGGGRQHAEWSDRAKQLRENGYYIATFLADIEADSFVREPDYTTQLKQMVLEKFLIQADNGWILRKARFYRGAFQVEDEEAGGRELLLTLAADPVWRGEWFVLLREAVRALPHGGKDAPLIEMRQLSRDLAEKDADFYDIRTKLHGNPDAGDAELVQNYALQQAPEKLVPDYEHLVDLIREIYTSSYTDKDVSGLAERLTDTPSRRMLEDLAPMLDPGAPTTTRVRGACRILSAIRTSLPRMSDPETVLAFVDLSIGLEESVYRSLATVLEDLKGNTRLERLHWMGETVRSLYGTGLLSRRQLDAAMDSLNRLDPPTVDLASYKSELDYLSRLPEWSESSLEFHFQPQVERLGQLEPKTRRFVHDRLHVSPLLLTSALLDQLTTDADVLIGVEHSLFGNPVTFGLNGLNPGLARGVVETLAPGEDPSRLKRGAIAMLPATTDDLPRVAGIITRGRGNILSHVQLLARNLGIPNVAVEERHLSAIESRRGQTVVMAISPRGVVHMSEDGPHWDQVFKREEKPDSYLIVTDLDQLQLHRTEPIPLDELRSEDSGRVCGPKAANLGELKHRYPEAVAGGLVLPFGVYREILERPAPGAAMTMMDWMRQEYDRLRAMEQDPGYESETADFLATVREWFKDLDLDEEFKRRLKQQLEGMFGPDGSYGVFVRSDTNVEDLPGFTGAGLNLTVPNAVGFDTILEGILRVWASPFTERAFGWRQSHMDAPEHLYVSVLLMESVAADKSGVMVTTDVNTGSHEWLTVAVNEGVGGAVAGQDAEELLVHRGTGRVRLLAQASEPRKRILLPGGGLDKVPASGSDSVLTPEEIEQLIDLAVSAPKRFEGLTDEQGNVLPADIEFGFKNGRLVLFQIRPFLSSSRARESAFLKTLDRSWRSADQPVDLLAVPKTDLP
ncbi:MAG: PEP/pyruvate-binding domain-containing protein [Desulfohalobiaceae bacterium]